jgi:hypothetical protein
MKQYSKETEKDFTDSWWFLLVCVAVSGLIFLLAN